MIPAADVFDELEEFVDSEPVAWSGRPARRAMPEMPRERADDDFDEPMADAALADDEADFDDHIDEAPLEGEGSVDDREPFAHARFADEMDEAHEDVEPADDDGGLDAAPAFSSAPAQSSRREAFAQRLSEELDRPAPPPAKAEPPRPAPPVAERPEPAITPPAPKPAPPAASAPQFAPSAASVRQPAPPAASAPQPAPSAASAPQFAPRPAGSEAPKAPQPPRPEPSAPAARLDVRPEPAAPKPDARPEPRPAAAGTPPRRSLATPTAPKLPAPPRQLSAPPPPPAPEIDLDSLAFDLSDDDDSPTDALDWELDNAISAIVQNNHKAAADAAQPEPTIAEAAPAPQPEPAAPVPAPQPRVHDPLVKSDKAEVEAATPRAPVGTKRQKPVPSFQFSRRAESDEPDAAPTDFDNPLSSIFFQDVREHFDAVHPEGAHDFEDDPGIAIDDIDPDGLEDEYAFSAADEDRLPPSLRRAARGRGKVGSRMASVATVVVLLGVLVGLGVIGFNVFAGNGGGSHTPPVIHADARDVKVRAEGVGIEAEPDIMERTQLGETEELVLPDRVEIGRASSPITVESEESEEALASRRVRTVVLRPDGTIMTADPSSGAARRARAGSGEPDAPAEVTTSPVAVSPDLAAAEAASTPDEEEEEADSIGETIGIASVREDAAAAPDPTALEGTVEDALAEPPTGPATIVTPPPRPTPPVRTARAAPAAAAPAAPAASAPATPEFGSTRSYAEQQQLQPPQPAQPAETQIGANQPFSAWGVQVSSQRSRTDAEQSFANLRARFPSIIGNIEPMIVPADVADRGLFYRVRLPASSRGEANTLCQRLKAAGADCFIGRN